MSVNKKLILIIEDNKDMQSLLVNIFEEEGFRTLIADNGETAINMFDDLNIDVMLLDKRLPDIDGFSIISQARDLGLDSKIVLLTAYGDPAIQKRALDLGADAYMTKPFNNFELISLVKQIVG